MAAPPAHVALIRGYVVSEANHKPLGLIHYSVSRQHCPAHVALIRGYVVSEANHKPL